MNDVSRQKALTAGVWKDLARAHTPAALDEFTAEFGDAVTEFNETLPEGVTPVTCSKNENGSLSIRRNDQRLSIWRNGDAPEIMCERFKGDKDGPRYSVMVYRVHDGEWQYFYGGASPSAQELVTRILEPFLVTAYSDNAA